MNSRPKNKFDKKRVAVIGEMLVDVFGDRAIAGGAPFNVARHLATFGVRVCLVSRIGSDAYGAQLCREAERFGLPTWGLQVDAALPTGVARVHDTGHGHRFEIPVGHAFDAIDGIQAAATLGAFGADLIYHGSLVQRTAASRKALADAVDAAKVRHPGMLHYVDLNLRPDGASRDLWRELLLGATMLKLSCEELDAIVPSVTPCGTMPAVGGVPNLDTVACAAKTLLDTAPSVGLLIVTLGSGGAVAYLRGAEACYREGITAAKIVDTVGAGDAFSSVSILGQLAGWPLATTLERANRFAAAICGIQGAVPDNPGFYDAWVEQWSDTDTLQTA